MKFLFLLLIAFCVFQPQALFAHVSQTEGSLTATLHINPGDRAQVGKNAVLQFKVEDSSKAFSFDTCQCEITIKDQETIVFTSSPEHIQKISDDTVRVKYVFQHTGNFTVILTGTTLTGLDPFTFNFKVDAEEVQPFDFFTMKHHLIHHSFHIITFGIAFIASGFIIFKKEEKN